MKVIVGSKNEIKINAVKESINSYDILSDAEVSGSEVSSQISDQPKSMDETIKGAMNRAKNAFVECDYAFGIEDGLFRVPNTKTDFMNVCVCVIFDGREYHVGLSSGFEYPSEVTRLVLDEGLDIEQAFLKSGLTDKPKLGSAEGAIGILTKGRLMRKEYTKQAVLTSLIHLENSELFFKPKK